MQPEHRFTSQIGAGSSAQHLFGAAIIKYSMFFSVTDWKQSRCSVQVTGIDGGVAVAICFCTSLTLSMKNSAN